MKWNPLAFFFLNKRSNVVSVVFTQQHTRCFTDIEYIMTHRYPHTSTLPQPKYRKEWCEGEGGLISLFPSNQSNPNDKVFCDIPAARLSLTEALDQLTWNRFLPHLFFFFLLTVPLFCLFFSLSLSKIRASFLLPILPLSVRLSVMIPWYLHPLPHFPFFHLHNFSAKVPANKTGLVLDKKKSGEENAR